MTWLDRLKNSDMRGAGTDKTDRTQERPLLSVLAVAGPGSFEKSRAVGRGLRMVEFRLTVDAPGRWHVALGADTDDLIADLRSRYGGRLDDVRVPDSNRYPGDTK